MLPSTRIFRSFLWRTWLWRILAVVTVLFVDASAHASIHGPAGFGQAVDSIVISKWTETAADETKEDLARSQGASKLARDEPLILERDDAPTLPQAAQSATGAGTSSSSTWNAGPGATPLLASGAACISADHLSCRMPADGTLIIPQVRIFDLLRPPQTM